MPRRYLLVGLCFAATFVCYIDRINISVAIIPMAEALHWDASRQGLVLSSFFVGYLLTQVVGGRLADRFGGKVVLATGVLWWSLFTLLTPVAAMGGFAALIAARIAMGLGEAVTFPSVYTLYSRWLPVQERARGMALNNSGIPIGTIFALIVTPMIVARLGWEWAFYAFGMVGVIWAFFWIRYTASTPEAHKDISQAELQYIRDNTPVKAADTRTPSIREFLKHGPVWAIMVAHFCNNWSLYVLLSWMPTFVNKGLGVDFASVGWYTMIPNAMAFLFMNVAGTVADRLIKRGMDVGRVRKLMQTIGFGGITIALAVVGEVQSAPMAIAVMAAGSAIGGFVMGGFVVNHLDIAPHSAGTLMGITNTVATIPGIIGVYVSGLILDWTGSWTLVFQVTAGVTLFGLLFYLFFASSKKIFD
jgi:ACS family sodium-dependent inorganic phosphate cotransporter